MLYNHTINIEFFILSHLATNETRFSTGGYFCPICENKYCELPVECGVCGMFKQNTKVYKIIFRK